MPRDQIIVGLDVGSSTISTVVAKLRGPDLPPQIMGLVQVPSQGIRRGTVIDFEEARGAIEKSVREAELVSGLSITHVYVGIGGAHIEVLASRGVVAVSRADGEIAQEDVERAISQSQAISTPPNQEVLHIIPREFLVDGQGGIKNVVGMSGIRLEVETVIVRGASPFIRALARCVSEAGLTIEGFIVNPLASSYAVLSKKQKELGVLLLDLGGGTTGLSIFEEGDLLHTKILPVGSSHITSDIAIGLRIGIDEAEKIKIEHGAAYPHEINKRDTIVLPDTAGGGRGEGAYSRREVADIIHARLSETISLVRRELKEVGRDKLLPAGVILVGGGAKLPGVVDLVREELMLPAQIGFPAGLEGVLNEVDDPAFATALGLILWAIEFQPEGGKGGGLGGVSFPSFFSGLSSGKLRKWFRVFIP